jgi:hypothetical protein
VQRRTRRAFATHTPERVVNLSIDEFLAFFGQLVEKLNDQVNKG